MSIIRSRLRCLAFCCLALFLNGCAAAMTGLEHKDLDVRTISSDTIFMDIEDRPGNRVFVDVRSTADRNLNIREGVIARLISQGYEMASSPRRADYILQANILAVGKVDENALKQSARNGYGGGGIAAGVLGGALIGAATNSWRGVGTGAVVGALAGALVEGVSGVLVKTVTYAIVTDVMISERTSQSVRTAQVDMNRVGRGSVRGGAGTKTTNMHRYTTRIASYATKANLKFEEALPHLEDGLIGNIAGIFGHY